MLSNSPPSQPSAVLAGRGATSTPVALRKSGVTVGMGQGRCELSVPYTGTLTPQAQATVASTLRRLMIELRYGTRLKGLTVSAGDQVLTVTAIASNFAIEKWLDSGDFVAAVDRAVGRVR